MALLTNQEYLKKTLKLGLILGAIVLTANTFFLSISVVNGNSMEPTLHDEQQFAINKFKYLFQEPKRFDIVQLYDPVDKNKLLVKRVIGLPNETLQFTENKVSIISPDGTIKEIDEPYLKNDVVNAGRIDKPATIYIPDGTYYVMGDNRTFSTDSRDFGPATRTLILGKVIAKVSPAPEPSLKVVYRDEQKKNHQANRQ
ncbi:signal peptidase I [Candidatus Gracilibacteria bacterium]|nr:signal peptidase I [Candidatus Gracilibacteria bacterium]